MSDKKIKYLLIDTSYLHAVSFKDPDFRKLLHHSQENVLKIFIPHIAWEERRTQFLEKVFAKMGKVNDAFEKLNADLSGDFVLYGLPPPTLNIWTKVDVNA